MKFLPTALPGVFLIEPERVVDERGHFARLFDRAAFLAQGLDADLGQLNTSFNARKGTLRGLHYQAAPKSESKLVSCPRGSFFEVVVDLRPGPTRGQWISAALSAETGVAIFIPKGCAHGFLTLEDATEVAYLMTDDYAPAQARGLRWDDPALAIRWPFSPAHLAPKDAAWPDFSQEAH